MFLILMLIIYVAVSETYGYLTSRNRLVPRPVTLRGCSPERFSFCSAMRPHSY